MMRSLLECAAHIDPSVTHLDTKSASARVPRLHTWVPLGSGTPEPTKRVLNRSDGESKDFKSPHILGQPSRELQVRADEDADLDYL